MKKPQMEKRLVPLLDVVLLVIGFLLLQVAAAGHDDPSPPTETQEEPWLVEESPQPETEDTGVSRGRAGEVEERVEFRLSGVPYWDGEPLGPMGSPSSRHGALVEAAQASGATILLCYPSPVAGNSSEIDVRSVEALQRDLQRWVEAGAGRERRAVQVLTRMGCADTQGEER